MARRDWLLLALADAGEQGHSPAQIQKTMFVFWKGTERVLSPQEFYNFVPHNYGPFDAAIYQDIEMLAMVGLSEIVRSPSPGGRIYRVTQLGLQHSEQLRLELPGDAVRYLAEAVTWVKSKSFVDLVRTIYQNWPEYRENSIFVD
jgi:uncharacterized protein